MQIRNQHNSGVLFGAQLAKLHRGKSTRELEIRMEFENRTTLVHVYTHKI